MPNNRTLSLKADFLKTAHFLPLHQTNLLKDKVIRKDNIFQGLAGKVFDYPLLLKVLLKKLKPWLSKEKSELSFAIAGYLYYLNGEYRKAAAYFLKSIEQNPLNLDNWFDLAFSLYHSNTERAKLGQAILFDFDLFMRYYGKLRPGKASLELMEQIRRRIILEKRDYSKTYQRYINRYYRR